MNNRRSFPIIEDNEGGIRTLQCPIIAMPLRALTTKRAYVTL